MLVLKLAGRLGGWAAGLKMGQFWPRARLFRPPLSSAQPLRFSAGDSGCVVLGAGAFSNLPPNDESKTRNALSLSLSPWPHPRVPNTRN